MNPCFKSNTGKFVQIPRHPNIIKYYETYEHVGASWIIMELMEGGNLTSVQKKIHKEKKRMEEPEIAFIIREMLKGLQFLLELGWIYRDVKSDNILLT